MIVLLLRDGGLVLLELGDSVLIVALAKQPPKQKLRPHDAMNGRGGVVSNGACGVGLRGWFGLTFVTLGDAFDVYGDLSEVPRGAALYQRHARCQADAIDVAPRGQVVERVEHQCEFGEELGAKGVVLDVCAHAYVKQINSIQNNKYYKHC